MGLYMSAAFSEHQTPCTIDELREMVRREPWAIPEPGPEEYFLSPAGRVSFSAEATAGDDFQGPRISIRTSWGAGPAFAEEVSRWARFAAKNNMTLVVDGQSVSAAAILGVVESFERSSRTVTSMFGSFQPPTRGPVQGN